MSRKLILIRHCEAEFRGDDGTDHGRRLSSLGRGTAREIGAWMERTGEVPDIVLCSSAMRAVDTWACISSELSAPPVVQFRTEIYDASVRELQHVIEATVGRSICVIGHNPSLAVIANSLSKSSAPNNDLSLFPCGTVAVLKSQSANWAPFSPGFFGALEVFKPALARS